MKKIVLVLAALFALTAMAFAKSNKGPKLNRWKDIAKIADKQDLEVVEDYVDRYVAKSADGKEFAFFAIKDYADIKVTLAMACLDGELFSKTTCVDKESGQPAPIFTINENDEKCVLENGGDLTYYINEEGMAGWTKETIFQRERLRDEIAKEYGLVISK
ncbi:MAG: hypothetical protein K5917_06310 [Clostridiales bacterium]|nr:hypothetical protein [Clostridiales bacterium]